MVDRDGSDVGELGVVVLVGAHVVSARPRRRAGSVFLARGRELAAELGGPRPGGRSRGMHFGCGCAAVQRPMRSPAWSRVRSDPAGVNRAVGNGAGDGLGLERVAKAGLILDGVARHLKVEGKNGTNSVWIVLPGLERSFNRTILLVSLPDGRCFGNLQLSPWLISTSKRDASRVARYPQKVRRR